MVRSEGERKITTTSTTSTQNPSMQQKKVEKIVEAYKDIFTTPVRVPVHCQVKHSIDLIPGAPLTNGTVYKCSLKENDEIK